MDIDYELSESHLDDIMNFIIDNIDIAETLKKLSINLYHSYENRKQQFLLNKNNKSKLKDKFMIPISKMNFEERLFYSMLTRTNLKTELPYIVEYLTLLYERIIELHRVKPNDSLANSLTLFVAEKGLVVYFSTMLKRFHEKEFEEETEKKEEKEAKPRSQEEIDKELEELQNHPLFMTELPKDIESNKHLQAIQALQYEGKPEDVALDLLDKSKEKLKIYKTSKNRKFLKEAMLNICNAIDHVEGDDNIPSSVKHTLYIHRGEIQLLVKNWGYAIDDYTLALKYVEDEESYLNIIDCYIKLENYDKAGTIWNEKKNMYKNSTIFQEKGSVIEKLIKEDQSKVEKFELFKDLSKSEKLDLYKILKKKGIKMKPQIHNIPGNYASKIYPDEENILHFPILIIYEEFNYTDYIQDFSENALIQDIFDILFQEKLPWDKENKYHLNSIAAFYEISEQDKKQYCRYYPLRNDDVLIDVLRNKKVYLNGLPVISIVSQTNMFYQHFNKTKIIIKR